MKTYTPDTCPCVSQRKGRSSNPPALLLTVAAFSAVALGSAVQAQPAPAPATPPADQTVQLDEFVVRDYHRSLVQSLEAKRNSSAIVDVISAEDVGKFPDTNVAESLSHLPGVTVDRLFGQGERVSVLGTDPNLSRTLLNGQTIATGDWFILDQPSRQFNYTLLAPEVLGRAEVYRTTEARLPEGSVGATIMLHTRKPLDKGLSDFTVAGSAGILYNDRNEKDDFNASQMISWRNKSGTFGVLLGLQSAREHIRRDGIEALGMVDNAARVVPTAGGPAIQAGGLTPLPASGASIVNALNYALFNQVRSRKGGNLAVQVKPTDELLIEFNGLKVNKTDHNQNNSFYWFPGATNWGGAADTAGNPMFHRGNYSNVGVVNGIVDSATVTNAPIVQDVFNRKAKISTEYYSIKGAYQSADWKVSQEFGTTKSESGTFPQYFIEFFAPDAGTVNVRGLTSGSPTMSITGYNNANMIAGGGWSGNMAYAANTDKEDFAQLDIEKPIAFGIIRKLLGGIRVTDHETSQNSGAGAFIPAGTATFTPADVGGRRVPGNFGEGLNVDASVRNAILVPDASILLGRVSTGPGVGGKTLEQSIYAGEYAWPVATWKITEQVNAGYIQANFSQDNWSGNFGLRYAHTSTRGDGSQGPAVWASPTQVNPVITHHSYDSILPSFNMTYGLQKNMDIRLGLAQVIARPNFADMSTSAWTNDTIRSGQAGNPNLDPYEATNVDLAFDWYFLKDSVASVTLFYKNIDNYILQGTAQVTATSQTGVTQVYNLNVPVNGGKAKSQGVLLSYQQPFSYGFGMQANYAWVDTSAPTNGIDTSSTSLKIAAFNSGTTQGVSTYVPSRLPFASEHTFNLSPYFENDRFLARLTYSWRSEYFTGFNRGVACFTQDTTQVDANASIYLTKNLSLTFAGLNLTDETYLQYGKIPAKVFQYSYKTGRRFTAGVHVKF